METGLRRTDGSFRTMEENLKYICQRLKIPVTPKQLEAARHVRFNYVKKALKPRKDALETLSQIKSDGYKIGLISNCSTEPPIIWPNTPFAPYFDVTIFSSTACLLKPDPLIFQMAIKQLNVASQKCLYVGDGASDELPAAAKAGMTPVLIRAPYEDKDDALRPDDSKEVFTGICITSLKEVLNLVK